VVLVVVVLIISGFHEPSMINAPTGFVPRSATSTYLEQNGRDTLQLTRSTDTLILWYILDYWGSEQGSTTTTVLYLPSTLLRCAVPNSAICTLQSALCTLHPGASEVFKVDSILLYFYSISLDFMRSKSKKIKDKMSLLNTSFHAETRENDSLDNPSWHLSR
jgi:hypothetical protein